MKTNALRIILALATSVVSAHASYTVTFNTENQTTFEKKMTISFTGYSGTALTDFPVLVRLSPGAINGFTYVDFHLENGGDLRFADSDGNLLPHEIDTWKPTGLSTVWVKVPSLTSSTTITAYYGCDNPPSVSAKDVWDDDYVGVWHLGESGLPMKESSETSVNITQANNGADIDFASPGIVGGAVDFKEYNKKRLLYAPDHAALDGFSTCTLEMWTYQTTNNQNAGILSKRAGYNNNVSYQVYDSGSGSPAVGLTMGTTAANGISTGATLYPGLNAWNHLVYTFDSGTVTGYRNGTATSPKSFSSTTVLAGTGMLCIGSFDSSDARNFPGKVDEVRISKTVRSQAWIQATYDVITDESVATYEVDGAGNIAYGPLDMTAFAKRMTVSFTGYSGAALTDFPVLVKLSTAIPRFSYADFCLDDGVDLRFADSNGNLLPHEIDTWDENGVSTVWVKVPSLTSDTTITACYGCPNPPGVAAKDVWDSDYVGVWHLGESALPMKESSKTSTDFTQLNGTGIGFASQGIIGGSVNFGASGNSRSLIAPDHDELDGFSQCTFEAWTYIANRPTGSDKNTGFLSKRISSSNQASYYLHDNGSATLFYISSNGTSPSGLSSSVKADSDAWTHQAYTFDGTTSSSNVKGWKNGANVGTATTSLTSVYAGSASLYLGNFSASDSRNFPGKIDELRISKVARSGDWIKATHDTVAKADFARYYVEYGLLNTNYYAKSINVAFTGYSGATLTDFPVLVKLSTAIDGFSYADFTLTNGGDLRFTDADGKLLPHEIDRWDENGVSTAWVKVPSLTATTTIKAYYGCTDTPQEVTPKDVWDDDYVGVWHLGENALPLKESSEKTSDFSTSTGETVAYGADGAVGRAVNINNGAGNAVVAPDHVALDGFTQFTIETWTKQSAHKNDTGILSKRKGAYGEGGISYYMYDYNNKTRLVVSTNGWGSTVDVSLIAPAASGNWQHQVYSLDMTSDTDNVKGYLNGELSGQTSTGARKVYAGPGNLTLGNLFTNAQDNAFNGQIDEVRISKCARSAAWIKATHDTVMEANFAVYGAVCEREPDEPERILYINVDAGATNTLNTADVTAYITNIVKTGAGTLVASSIPDYSGGFDIQGGVFQVSNAGDCGAAGAVINVRDGASLLFNGGANTVLDGKTVNLYGAKNANLKGKIQCDTANNQKLGTDFTLNLFADATIYGNGVNFQLWTTAIDLNGHELVFTASGNWYTARIGGQILNGGALTYSNSTFYVESSGAVPQFSADCAATASVKLKANAIMNCKQLVASNGWTLESNGCAIRGNVNRWPTNTSMPVWDGPIVSKGSSSIASYTGGWNVSNTVFNAKGPFSGSGTLSVGPGWLNLHNSTNTYAGAVTITGQLLESTAQQFTPILPGSGGIGLWNGAACFTNASSVTFNNSARLAFMDNTICTVGTNIVFAGGADDMQSISGGVYTARSTMGGFRKTGAGTLVVDSPVAVTGLADIQAGTLKVAYRSDPTAQSQKAMLNPLPVFSSVRFADGANLDLSDNLGIVLGSLEGSPVVTNSGMFGVSGTWKLVNPAGRLKLLGRNASGGQAAGVLCFLSGATFDLADEEAFRTAVAAAGPDGLLVAEANWILDSAQEGLEVSVALPTPAPTIASGWSMSIGNDSNGAPGRGLYLRLPPKPLLFWIAAK